MSEVNQKLKIKHLHEIFTMNDSAAMIAEKYDFNFERTHKFRTGWQDVLSVYKELYDRKMREAKQIKHTVLFKPVTSATADNEPQPLTSRQTATEGVDISDLPGLMDSDNDEMLRNDPLPLFPTP